MYSAAADGVARAAGDADKWYMGASFIGQAIKACDAGLRATGAIQTGTVNNVRVLVLPASARPTMAEELPCAIRRELPEAIDAEIVEEEED